MSNYVGASAEQYFQQNGDRFFYGLRRTDDGELFLGKVDQMAQDDVVQINKIGDPVDNYPNYEEGQEFYEGRDYVHNLVYANLNYEQFKHDDRDIFYYINDSFRIRSCSTFSNFCWCWRIFCFKTFFR